MDIVDFNDLISKDIIDSIVRENKILIAYEANTETVAWCYENYDIKTNKIIKFTNFYGLPVNKNMNQNNKIKLNNL